jgi:Domain of unknown function (DUF6438)
VCIFSKQRTHLPIHNEIVCIGNEGEQCNAVPGAIENLKHARQRKEFHDDLSHFEAHVVARPHRGHVSRSYVVLLRHHAEGIESLTVSTGPCFGYCPIYDLTVNSEGVVKFHGERHTMLLGDRELHLSPAKYKEATTLLEPFRPADTLISQTKCDDTITDGQTYEITWTNAAGQKKILRHNRGCLSAQNEKLNQALDRLPALLGVEDLSKQITRPGVSRG